MKRPRHIWLAFAGCAAVVLAAMAWISVTTLRLEREQADADRRAVVQEKIRLALWRMELALAPMTARENTRPYFAYTAFHPVDRAYTRMFAEIRPHEVLTPSPLLTYQSRQILLHFQFDPAGALTSPQVPAGNQRDLAETGYTTHQRIDADAKRLAQLRTLLSAKPLLAALPASDPPPSAIAAAPHSPDPANRDALAQQIARNESEFRARGAAARRARASQVDRALNVKDPGAVRENALQPVWVGQTLVLARRVRVNGDEYVQGCWLDWPEIRRWLLADTADLVPHADLRLAVPGDGDDHEQRNLLAALPVELLPGEVPIELPAAVSPVGVSLTIAWGCVLLGAGAVALVLHGSVTLSERRGAFVSAVTHELRTPLTTFRLYTDMLAGGMITDEDKRRDYIRRLNQESERLSHLVENVLLYARLSGTRRWKDLSTITLGELVDRSRDRLTTRAERADMALTTDGPAEALQTSVRVDISAVEQILLNLVDNACKYAARAENNTIHVEVARRDGLGQIRVRDHGPGIEKSETRRLYRPFHKSAHEAARAAPGVGLGLALSRRLARDMRGDLHLADTNAETNGACFILSLPLAAETSA